MHIMFIKYNATLTHTIFQLAVVVIARPLAKFKSRTVVDTHPFWKTMVRYIILYCRVNLNDRMDSFMDKRSGSCETLL
jgi:hypothetical protein